MDQDFTVAGFDPGGKTGWAWFELMPEKLLQPDNDVHDSIYDWDYGYYAGPEFDQVDRIIYLIRTLQRKGPLLGVVTEDFILAPGKATMGREMLSPVRINAALGYQLRLEGIPLDFQMPSYVSKLTDDRLRALGLYAPQKDARMAVKHAYTWAQNRRIQILRERRDGQR